MFFPLLLGVKVEIVRGIFFASCEKAAVKKTERMVGATLASAKLSPSPWFFLVNLWEEYDVPGILYTTESTPLSMATINRLDGIQRDLVMWGTPGYPCLLHPANVWIQAILVLGPQECGQFS